MVKRIIVTGAGGPAGINFTLSLRNSNEKMYLIGTENNRYHIHLTQTDKSYLLPRATDEDYIEKLNGIIKKEKIEFIHPQPDIEVLTIGENREKINAKTFLPSQKTLEICMDKFLSTRVWKKEGIPTAEIIEIENENHINRAFARLGSPIWIRSKQGAGGRGSTIASNIETASAWIKYWRERRKDWKFIAQKYLPGRNIGFHSLFRNGKLITSMARERLEYIYPHLAPSGITGTPSVQRTIHDEEVNKIGTEAVLAVDPEYTGIACVDLKENYEGKPCPTEINSGRMFTTSYFFSYAGSKIYKECDMKVRWFANIPYFYLKLAFKESLPKIPEYNILPKDLYWIRHIDAGSRLVRDGKVIGKIGV
jgi:carbamoyl-phosphate synthase large subunit